jgi:hypothetical protein
LSPVAHVRDKNFSHAFDEVFRSEAIEVIRTPIEAPNANAYAERWVRTVRADCLDRILILGRRHLEHVLRVYRRHYNEHRPHRALNLLPPDGRDSLVPRAESVSPLATPRSSVGYASGLSPILVLPRSCFVGCSALVPRSVLAASTSTRCLSVSWSACTPAS